MPDSQVANDTSSLLSAHLWDVRASLEAQVRCITAVQRNLAVFNNTSNEEERVHLRDTILSDLAQIGRLSLTVIARLEPTLERAGVELHVP